jgi:arsenite-transporting ATPase
VLDLLSSRQTIFFGGKGGVGKTTCASAVAVSAAHRGRCVLLISTDPAHSTSDMLETTLGADPRKVLPRLDAVELDPAEEARRFLGEVRQRVGRLFSPSVARQASRQLDVAADTPGLEETATLERLVSLFGIRDRYDLTIVDTAPSGHTLRLLRLPETMAMWVGALAKARTAVAAESTEPDALVTALDERLARLKALRAHLTNARATSFVLVVTPERLAIEETARTAAELEAIGIAVGAIVVNRVLPAEAEGEFLAARRRQEQQYLSEIDSRLARFPRARVPQMMSDVHGIGQLEEVAEYFVR